ncbi:hypothetical protein [Sinomicrobium sp.]
MTTLIVIIAFMGFYAFYNASKRAVLSQSWWIAQWLQSHRPTSLALGWCMVLVGILLSVMHYGFGAGICAFVVVLMTVGSLIVIVSPLKFISYRAVVLIAILSFAIELILPYAGQ